MNDNRFIPIQTVNDYMSNITQNPYNGYYDFRQNVLGIQAPQSLSYTSSTPTQPIQGNTFSQGLRNLGNQLQTGFGKMSLGEKGSMVLGAVGSALNAYNAYKSNKLAKDQFNFQKQAWQANFNNQRKMTNSQLEDRQKARVANNPIQNESVDSYMRKYGV